MKLFLLRVVVINYLIFLWPCGFLSARELIPSIARVRDKIEHAKNSGASVKKTTIQELLETSATTRNIEPLSVLLQDLKALVWSNQASFIKDLSQKCQQSKEQAVVSLKEVILAHFGQEKHPLVSFCHALQTELVVIQQNTTKLFSMMSKKEIKESSDASLIQDGFDIVVRLKNNMEALLTLVNDLLL